MEVHGKRKQFHRHLRMTLESFNLLLSYIKQDIQPNSMMAALRGGAIIPELRLYCTLRYLAGGLYSDVAMHAGISQPSFYRIIWETIDAINQCKQLSFVFPSTREKCITAGAEQFESISYGLLITNCVGCIDGYRC